MNKARFFRLANSNWRMKFFLLWKLPAAWFMGIGVKYCDEDRTVVRLPYGWRSQNPFHSIYFAAQCAAGELSTGLLALASLQEQAPVSMLVTDIRAEFYKKASETVYFECIQGKEVQALIEKALISGESQTLVMTSFGRLSNGVEVSKIQISWSFKKKNG